MGTMRKRSPGKWELVVSAGANPPTGRYHRVVRTVATIEARGHSSVGHARSRRGRWQRVLRRPDAGAAARPVDGTHREPRTGRHDALPLSPIHRSRDRPRARRHQAVPAEGARPSIASTATSASAALRRRRSGRCMRSCERRSIKPSEGAQAERRVSWARIGKALGTTAQSAQHRYREQVFSSGARTGRADQANGAPSQGGKDVALRDLTSH
jgi:hypothetical protein